MSNYPSPIPTPAVKPLHQQQPRKRRSGQKNRKRKKQKLPFSLWQLGVLLLLLILLIVKWSDLNTADRTLNDLRESRERAEKEYQELVSSHQTRYRDTIKYYAAVNRIDPAYVAAIIKRESDYDPHAVSNKGARGLMQLMPDSFEWIAPKYGIAKDDLDALFEPENAIKLGCYLLGYISPMFDGDPILVACAYHAGWGNVKNWVTKYSTDGVHLTLDQIPMSDTQSYVRKVINSYAIYQQYYY